MIIEHDSQQHKFFARLGSGEEANLMYAEKGRVLDFHRVYVPDAFRGMGMAAQITTAAFEYAAANGFQVIPTCPYVSGTFLPRFPKFQKLVSSEK